MPFKLGHGENGMPCKAGSLVMLSAFVAGADGVLVDGSIPEGCLYMEDDLSARRRIMILKPLEDADDSTF